MRSIKRGIIAAIVGLIIIGVYLVLVLNGSPGCGLALALIHGCCFGNVAARIAFAFANWVTKE